MPCGDGKSSSGIIRFIVCTNPTPVYRIVSVMKFIPKYNVVSNGAFTSNAEVPTVMMEAELDENSHERCPEILPIFKKDLRIFEQLLQVRQPHDGQRPNKTLLMISMGSDSSAIINKRERHLLLMLQQYCQKRKLQGVISRAKLEAG